MHRFPAFALLALLPFLLSSCAGYTLGGQRPAHLAAVRSIAVPLAVNDTLTPRASVFTTNAVVDAITRDGSYQLAATGSADAVLSLRLKSISYGQRRSSRQDSLRPEELEMRVNVSWQLTDADNPLRILEKGSTLGRSSFFVADNLQKARDNALPDALRRMAETLTSRLADGY